MPKHPWGLISLDWSVANQVWFLGNTSNTTCEATSITGCRMLKAAGLADRCFIYHNVSPIIKIFNLTLASTAPYQP